MAEVLREAKTKVVHKGERTIKEEKEETKKEERRNVITSNINISVR